MSILSKLRERRVVSIASSMVSITETGSQSVDNDLEKGNAFKILAELDDRSPQSISSLAKQCRIDIYAVNNAVMKLRNQGKVTVSDFHNRED